MLNETLYLMKTLQQYLLEKLNIRPVVIYGGKFQPFHAGHFEIYQKLVKEFGKENVFISTCDINKAKLKQKSYSENHIFTFDEKLLILDKIFNIPKEQVIQAKRTPYLPSWKEIPVEGSNYAYITVCGMKDQDRFDFLGNQGITVEEYEPNKHLESCITHKYFYRLENEKVHLSATDVRNEFRKDISLEEKKKYFEKAFGKYDEEIFNLVNDRINYIFESYNGFLVEGKVAGHIQHLYNDLSLTFTDLENIVEKGFSSNLEQAVEKVDGNPLAMTYRNGEFLFAWGDQPKNIDDLELEFFKDLPKKVYRRSCERMIRAFKENPKLKEWFSGNKLLHMEILASDMPNMIKYNRDAIVLHYMVEYDENGKEINKDRDLAVEIAQALSNTDEKIEIVGPPFVKLKDIDCTSIKNKFIKQLEVMMNKANVSKETSLLDYIIKLTNDFLEKNNVNVEEKNAVLITKKWLGLNKTHQFTMRAYKNQDVIDALTELDKKKGPDFVQDINNEIKVFIASICVDILKNMQSCVAKNVDDGAESIKKILKDAIKELSDTGELDSSEKLNNALKRINAIGQENLFPSEGILFIYNDKMYKITGMFADYIALSNIIRNKMKNNEYTR